MTFKKHQHIILAIANGAENFIFRESPESEWKNADAREVFSILSSAKHINEYDFEVSASTILIGDVEIFEPHREVLPYNTAFFIPVLTNQSGFTQVKWWGNDSDLYLLENGLVHLASENAANHSAALIQFTKKK